MFHRTQVHALILLVLLSGCVQQSHANVEIPNDKYLFVEYWVREMGLGACVAKYIDGPLYSQYSEDGFMELHSCDEKPLYSSREFDLRGRAEVIGDASVLLGMGRQYCGENWYGVYSVMYPLEKLPYLILESDLGKSSFGIMSNTEITISEVTDNDGAIRAKVDGRDTVIEPFQSWIYEITDHPEDSCERTITYSFTNYGLIDRDQVHLTP